jgi:hypothetical protein
LQIDPEELRRGYEEMSDAGLLSIDRKDLTEFAQPYYDAEIDRRGLRVESAEPEEKAPPQANPGETLVVAATFLSIYEADLSRTLLQSADIPAYLENDTSLSGTSAVRLMVPASFLEQAEEILGAEISDEELLAQAEAAEPID